MWLVVVVAAAVLLSWLTTSWVGSGRFPEGEWTICVESDQGIPLTNAWVTVLTPDGERTSYFGQDGRNGICADPAGRIVLRSSGYSFGGGGWSLLWIWRFDHGFAGPYECSLKVSAPLYKDRLLPVTDITSTNQITIRLELQ
jgi:hypothetical protein